MKHNFLMLEGGVSVLQPPLCLYPGCILFDSKTAIQNQSGGRGSQYMMMLRAPKRLSNYVSESHTYKCYLFIDNVTAVDAIGQTWDGGVGRELMWCYCLVSELCYRTDSDRSDQNRSKVRSSRSTPQSTSSQVQHYLLTPS